MKQSLEIVIGENIFEVKILDEKAPRTCKGILEILPMELEGYHYFWSGEGIQIHDPILKKMASENGLWPDILYPDTKENAKFNGVPGEVGFYPIGGSINITYGQARFYGPPRGVESNYIWGVIKDIERLEKVGKTFKKEGGQKIKIRLKNAL